MLVYMGWNWNHAQKIIWDYSQISQGSSERTDYASKERKHQLYIERQKIHFIVTDVSICVYNIVFLYLMPEMKILNHYVLP